MNGNIVKAVLWGRTVGYLSWDKADDRDFLSLGWDISPLQLSLSSKRVHSGLDIRGGNPKNAFRGLPPVFADSLPDHWGNALFRSWAREHQVSMRDVSAVDYLSFIG